MYIANNNNNQNSNNQKIILVKKSNSPIKSITKSLMLVGAGWGSKYAWDNLIKKESQESGVIFNGEFLDYFYKRLSTKPNSWTYSPRYYLIKFLNSMINYDSKKSTDNDIILILKYLILATLPTTGKTSEEKMFGTILSPILKEFADHMDSDFINNNFYRPLVKLASYKDAKLARWLVFNGINDIKFLQASSNDSTFYSLIHKNSRSNLVLNNINKKDHGKFLESLSNNLKKHFNTSIEKVEKSENKTPNKKIVFNSSDDPQLIEEDKKKIFNLLKDNNINPDIHRIIKFDAYQLSVLFFDLIFRMIISQTFDNIQENKKLQNY